MGPFPHDAPKAKIDRRETSPGPTAFEFVKFSLHPEPASWRTCFRSDGLIGGGAPHSTKGSLLFRQVRINYASLR